MTEHNGDPHDDGSEGSDHFDGGEEVTGGAETAGAVSFADIVKRFSDVVAVEDLNLHIESGEFFALLGPSGCGKTTTLRMVAGLEFPTRGSLTIGGTEVGTLPPNKRPVNTVFQNYALFPHLDVADNVGFGLKMQRVSKAERAGRVHEALDMVKLGEYGKRKPSQLSGGQQQRVALARAIVNRPQVLLLDEPLAALDLKLRQGMQDELKSIQRELGITFIFVTHDQEEALTMSDRIGVMNEGRLLQVGTPEEIYEQPTSRFVADFIGRSNFLPGTASSKHIVTLENGDKIRALHTLDPGTKVSISIRPETLDIEEGDTTAANDAGDETTALCVTVLHSTYMGEAVVYRVGFDWMELEVRQDNLPGHPTFSVGDEVTVKWLAQAAAVVPGDD